MNTKINVTERPYEFFMRLDASKDTPTFLGAYYNYLKKARYGDGSPVGPDVEVQKPIDAFKELEPILGKLFVEMSTACATLNQDNAVCKAALIDADEKYKELEQKLVTTHQALLNAIATMSHNESVYNKTVEEKDRAIKILEQKLKVANETIANLSAALARLKPRAKPDHRNMVNPTLTK